MIIPSPNPFFDRKSKLTSVTFALDLRSQTVFAIVKTKTDKFTDTKFKGLNLKELEEFMEKNFGTDVSSTWKFKTIVYVEDDQIIGSNDALCARCFTDLVVESKEKLVQMVKEHTKETSTVTDAILNDFKLIARYLLFFASPFKPMCDASTLCKKLELLKIDSRREGVKLDERAATELVELMSWPEMKSLEEAVDNFKPFDHVQSLQSDSQLLLGSMKQLEDPSKIFEAVTPNDVALLKQTSQKEFQKLFEKKKR